MTLPRRNGKKLLFLGAWDWYFVCHRLSLAVAAKNAGFDVTVATPTGPYVPKLAEAGIRHVPIRMVRQGKNPAVDAATLDWGGKRYNIYCAPCHGDTGHGDGPVTRRGGGFSVQPANLHMARLLPESLGYYFHVATNGKGKMRGYKAQIPVEDRWAIAAWVRTLQVSHTAKASDIPAGNAPSPSAAAPTDTKKGAAQ